MRVVRLKRQEPAIVCAGRYAGNWLVASLCTGDRLLTKETISAVVVVVCCLLHYASLQFLVSAAHENDISSVFCVSALYSRRMLTAALMPTCVCVYSLEIFQAREIIVVSVWCAVNGYFSFYEFYFDFVWVDFCAAHRWCVRGSFITMMNNYYSAWVWVWVWMVCGACSSKKKSTSNRRYTRARLRYVCVWVWVCGKKCFHSTGRVRRWKKKYKKKPIQ